MSATMPPHPHTGLINVTPGEIADALAATEDYPLVRPDGTLTDAGQRYVADMRTHGHEDCELCPPCACQWDGCPLREGELPECQHPSTSDTGTEPDGSTIVECDTCGERWNEGVA